MLGLAACGAVTHQSCNEQTQLLIEKQVGSGDGHGHGPDIGSDEWHSTIEFRLNIRGQNNIPDWHSQAWCDFVLAKTNH